MGDDAAAELAALTALTSLTLGALNLQLDAPALTTLTKLQRLVLHKCRLQNAGVAALATLSALVHLDLWEESVGNAGAAALAALSALTFLSLYGAADALCASLTKLRHLELGSPEPTRVSALAALTACSLR